MKRETRKTFTYSALPSIKKAAMKKAKKEGNTLSDVIENLLRGYVASPILSGGVILPPDYIGIKKVGVLHRDGTISDIF